MLKNDSKLYAYFIVAVALLLFANTLSNGFVYDDKIVLIENQHVQAGWAGIKEIWTTNHLNGYQQFNDALYRPMCLTVFNILHTTFGYNTVLFHLVNVLVFCLVCLMVFKVFVNLYPHAVTPVFLGTLIFTAHPVHTEVVANVKSLDELLALLFGLLAILSSMSNKKFVSKILLTLVFYVLALFSKESAITFVGLIPVFYFFKYGKFDKTLGYLFVLLLSIGGLWYGWHHMVIKAMPNAVDKGLFDAISNSIIGIEKDLNRMLTGLWLSTK